MASRWSHWPSHFPAGLEKRAGPSTDVSARLGAAGILVRSASRSRRNLALESRATAEADAARAFFSGTDLDSGHGFDGKKRFFSTGRPLELPAMKSSEQLALGRWPGLRSTARRDDHCDTVHLPFMPKRR